MIDIPDVQSLRTTLAIVQASPFCNIDCKYCYLPNRSLTHRMSPETLEKSIRFLMRKPGLLDQGAALVFHCGEPLAVPVEFYASAFDLVEKLNPGPTPVEVRFSTNATLINQAWCNEIKRRGYIKMRVSIDGPQWLHDAKRIDRPGHGTFERVKRGIDILRSNGIPFDVLCVVTQQTLEAAEELWYFFRGIGARGVGFCVEEVLGEHRDSSLQLDTAAAGIRKFFNTWLRLRNAEAPGFYVRELDELLEAIPRLQTYKEPLVRVDNVPFGVVTIGWDGSICLFSPELLNAKDQHYGDFIMGNVATHSVEDILASSRFQTLYHDVHDGVQQCKRDCRYFQLCGGGFPASKMFENGTFQSSETLTCRLRVQAITDVVLDHLAQGRTPANV